MNRGFLAWCPGCSNVRILAHTHYVARRPLPRYAKDLSRKEVFGEGNETWSICGSIRFDTAESMEERVRLYTFAHRRISRFAYRRIA